MKTRYSESTSTFYPYDIEYPNGIPSDAIEVDEVDHQRVMARALGETFSFDAECVLTIHPAPVVVVNPNDAVLAQIAAIEAATMVPRVTREFMMRVAEKDAAATGTDLAHDAAYQRVKAVDDQVRALRARLA